MSKDEEYVRSVWVSVDLNEGAYAAVVYRHDPYTIETIHALGSGNDAEAAWSAAAEFTREHEEKVRQLREEITLAKEMADIPESMKTLYERRGLEFSALFIANCESAKRIIARLESKRGRLTEGMKEEAA